MTVKLHPFQAEGVDCIDNFDGITLLAMEVGTGKTVVSLYWANENKSVRPIVVVCPASLKWNWQAEAAHHFGMRAEVLESTKPPKRRITKFAPLWVINYDILPYWLDFLRGLHPQLVILDEGHAIKSRGAKRTKAVRKLCAGVPHKLILTGTPIVNRPVELWTMLNILRPELYPDFWSYAFRYCDPKRAPWGWEYKGATHLDELHQRLLETCMFRRRKADVLKDLPPRSRQVVLLEMEGAKEYRKAETDFAGWLKDQKKANLHRALKAQALTKLGYLKRLAAKLKFNNVKRWTEDYLEESEAKLIAFGIQRELVGQLHSSHKGSALINGSVIGKDRQHAVDEFNKSKHCRLMVANIDAACAGWSAKVPADTGVFEIPWTPGQLDQLEGRAHGISRGGGRPTTTFYLVTDNTVESDLCKLVQKKREIADAVMDGHEVEDGIDIYDRLLKAVRERSK